MSSTENQVNTLALLAQQAFERGSPEEATRYMQEAVGILAEQAAVDATPLIDVLAYGLR